MRRFDIFAVKNLKLRPISVKRTNKESLPVIDEEAEQIVEKVPDG